MMYNVGLTSDSQVSTLSDQSISTASSIYMPASYNVYQPSFEANPISSEGVPAIEVQPVSIEKPIDVSVAPVQVYPVNVPQEPQVVVVNNYEYPQEQLQPVYHEESSSKNDMNEQFQCPHCHEVVLPENKMEKCTQIVLLVLAIITFFIGGFIFYVIIVLLIWKKLLRPACPKCGMFMDVSENNRSARIVPIFV